MKKVFVAFCILSLFMFGVLYILTGVLFMMEKTIPYYIIGFCCVIIGLWIIVMSFINQIEKHQDKNPRWFFKFLFYLIS